MASVTLEGVTKSFAGLTVVQSVDLAIAEGEFMVLVGPSGCGKSTTLRMIAGLEETSGGTIRIGARDVTQLEPRERNIAMVFQNYALYPHKSVRENLAFGLKMRGTGKAEIEQRVARAAAMLKIEPLLARKPRQLSGGQMQRVALGRALVREPDVFLFDEPLSNLDAKMRVHMRDEIARLHREVGTAMIYVTHDQVEAMTLGDRICVMKDGVVQQVGRPLDVYDRPANTFVAGFIGSPEMNFADGEIASEDGRPVFRSGPLALPLDGARQGAALEPGQPVTLGIRPEHLTVAATGLPARVLHVERMGAESVLQLDAGVGLRALVDRDDGVEEGDTIHLAAPANRLHLFGRDGLALGGAGR
ncbi:ABC transporter ATP-binding protein [Enterovirga rhinocerotis]|uniref:Carbohydrate ABC transporter ATP-binding protein (CUT1 family) n=1 Tax=Enterovirga rhinocerotis TaxID=1339210 RepID=A0A4R7BVB6_9HYPH|nr:sn-glycerol-3-phosphate ABC transporter ATP-binding protein UgpC [Enterovirga rhinocerotis]TDR89012.1 carbohydrate ABC transporter ATP-binding protein (CUT1 family) [Enterovirga rhinocerotis]